MVSAYLPLLDFMVVGAQKCGTTALAHYLGQHPGIVMSSVKEPHLFDSPDYSPNWTPEQIDERYKPFFRHAPPPGTREAREGTPTATDAPEGTREGTPTATHGKGHPPPRGEAPRDMREGTPAATEDTQEGPPAEEASPGILIRGEATPIYLFLPEIAPELMRYNPNLKLIVLLRDPVRRAISHYYMERNRGYEQLPLWCALIWEPWRLRRCTDARRLGSAWRRHSYRRRGLYSRQLRNLYRCFNVGQVLLVRTDHLAQRHDQTMQRIFRFLGVPAHRGIEATRVFQGERDGRTHRVTSWLLWLSYLPEFIRMRKFGKRPQHPA